jgi:hypothetical protein
MKWLYVAGWGGFWLFFVVGIVLTAAFEGTNAAEVGGGFYGLGALFLPLVPIGSMVWLYRAWSSVPPGMRYTAQGRWVTPGSAVGYCFIPFFNLYWVFVANVGLCDAIDRVLIAKGAAARAPKGLAIAACIGHLVPYCNLLVAPILWSLYMFMADSARREMLAGPSA